MDMGSGITYSQEAFVTSQKAHTTCDLCAHVARPGPVGKKTHMFKKIKDLGNHVNTQPVPSSRTGTPIPYPLQMGTPVPYPLGWTAN